MQITVNDILACGSLLVGIMNLVRFIVLWRLGTLATITEGASPRVNALVDEATVCWVTALLFCVGAVVFGFA